MPRGMTIKLQTHPMYADFIRHQMRTDDQGKVFASEKHKIGLLIKNLLRNRPEGARDPKFTDEPDRLVTLEFILPDYTDIDTTYRNYISNNSRRIIASKIRSHFYFELHEHIEEMQKAGVKEMRAIMIHFCELFEIGEDHYKTNTLEREYARYRDKVKIVKERRKITSVLMMFLSISTPLSVCF